MFCGRPWVSADQHDQFCSNADEPKCARKNDTIKNPVFEYVDCVEAILCEAVVENDRDRFYAPKFLLEELRNWHHRITGRRIKGK
jgi:hypothetical protein